MAVSVDFGQGKKKPRNWVTYDNYSAKKCETISTNLITCFPLRMAENAREPHVAVAHGPDLFIASYVTGVQLSVCPTIPVLPSCAFVSPPTTFCFLLTQAAQVGSVYKIASKNVVAS